MQQRVISLAFTAVVLFWVGLGLAAPRDKAANQKIDEAINNYYLATQFDRAEAVLKGTVDACEDRCAPAVKARAWMYVGVVRGSGMADISGAQEAFQQALALDPNVKLDDALATPAVRDAFAAAAATLGQALPQGTSGGGTTSSSGTLLGGGGDVEGDMECTPEVREVETRRPIPVSCSTDEPASKVSLRYKVFGGESWLSVPMTRKGDSWQGEIPCSDTGISGKLQWFVRAQDRAGDLVDNYGTKKGPVMMQLVESSDEDPPRLPGRAAPERCTEAGACPEDMIGTPACPGTGKSARQRGTKGWGAPCDDSWECDVGLLCTATDEGRTCETAPSCEVDADCPSGAACMDGTCDIAEGEAAGPSGPYKKNWIGLHVGMDLAFLKGDQICDPSNDDFTCYYASGGAEYRNFPNLNNAGNISGGIAPGTIRVLLSYERAIVAGLGLEVRGGIAFNGGPGSFLPVHFEGRAKYWFLKNPYGRKGIRPYVHLGGGMAQVDAKLNVNVADCGGEDTRVVDPTTGQRVPLDLTQQSVRDQINTCRLSANPLALNAPVWEMEAYRKLGQAFATVGGGAMYAIGANHGIVLNINYMFMLPTTGHVLEPSLGYLIGL